MGLMLPEPWETGKAANAVLRYSASPRHPSRNAAERQGAVPWTPVSPVPVRARPKRELGRHRAPGVKASSSVRPERAAHRLLCCQRQRCVQNGRPGCCVRLQHSARIGALVLQRSEYRTGCFCVA